jgi:hypothetical protein
MSAFSEKYGPWALGKVPSLVPGAQNHLATFLTARIMSRKSAVETTGKEMTKRYGADR